MKGCERPWLRHRSHREYEADGRGGSCWQPSENPHRLPLDIPKDVRRQPWARRIANLDGVAERVLNGLIRIHERQKSKVTLRNRVDEDIHVRIGFGFVAGIRSEQEKPPPRSPSGRVQSA